MEKPKNTLLYWFIIFFVIITGVSVVRGITYALRAATGWPVTTASTASR